MNPHDTLVQLEYLRLGLIPPNVNVKESLEKMTADESRKSRRKFRKMHRKARKEFEKEARAKATRKGFKETGCRMPPRRVIRENMSRDLLTRLDRHMGPKGKAPSLRQKVERQLAVKHTISDKVENDVLV